MKSFNVHFSKTTKVISTISILIFLLASGFIVYEIQNNNQLSLSVKSIILIAPLSILLTYLFMPKQYEINENELVIHRKIGNLTILRNDITQIEKIEAYTQLGFVIRLFGSGGLFGWLGIFYSGKYGKFKLYAGAASPLVMITYQNNQKIGISPIEIDAFIDSLNSCVELKKMNVDL
jgi:hypothetical protein